MIQNSHYTYNGYTWTFQKISKEISHLIIRDNNLYPDNDSRSIRKNEWLFPINNENDLKSIKKLFKL